MYILFSFRYNSLIVQLFQTSDVEIHTKTKVTNFEITWSAGSGSGLGFWHDLQNNPNLRVPVRPAPILTGKNPSWLGLGSGLGFPRF
jgi:hypothetical protein